METVLGLTHNTLALEKFTNINILWMLGVIQKMYQMSVLSPEQITEVLLLG